MTPPLPPPADGEPNGPSGAPDLTVFHDGACPLCRAEIGFYRRQRGADRIAFVDVARDDTALPRGVDRATALTRFHVETADGRVISGAGAFLALMATLPRLRRVARVGALPGIRHGLEALYRLFLYLRPALVSLFVRLQRVQGR